MPDNISPNNPAVRQKIFEDQNDIAAFPKQRRPKLIYFVAAWIIWNTWLILMPLWLLVRAIGLPPASPLLWVIAQLCFIAGIIVVVGLVQLRKLPRLISIGLMGINGTLCTWLFLKTLLTRGMALFLPPFPISSYLYLVLFVVIDVWVIWYLSSKRFVELSRQFREQTGQNNIAGKADKTEADAGPKCPSCGRPYRLADYNKDAERIFCTGCKGELPKG